MRPEHLKIDPERPGFRLRVTAVELQGAETIVHGDAQGAEAMLRLHGIASVLPGDDLPLAAEAGQLHLFDPTSRQRLV